jgi:hypothetical protein
MTLDAEGLTISTGDITTKTGDVLALNGAFSLQKHKHATAVPGPPISPTPDPPA